MKRPSTPLGDLIHAPNKKEMGLTPIGKNGKGNIPLEKRDILPFLTF
jgi:hypothetical protein